MLFAVATLPDATASRVLVLLIAIVLTATLLPAMLTFLATMLPALSTVTTLLLATLVLTLATLLLAALVLALATLLLATLLLVHEFLLREKTRRFRNSIENSIDLREICACTLELPFVSAIQISRSARLTFGCWLFGSLLRTLAVLCTQQRWPFRSYGLMNADLPPEYFTQLSKGASHAKWPKDKETAPTQAGSVL
jgi:hypothetical protein